jgi:hypothetical protein
VTAGVPSWLTGRAPVLIGVVHLDPLPGSPRARGSLSDAVEGAVASARAWEEGGADALLIENFGDAPFFPDRVPPETVASMTAALLAVRSAAHLPLGVYVLRNDAEAALAVAAASGASFLRANVLAHAFVADQGILEGRAHLLLRKRRELGVSVSIFADLLVKHAEPLAPLDPVLAARDLVEREGADALVVTGKATGLPPDRGRIEAVAGALPAVPLFSGSGTDPEVARALRPFVCGFLAATWCEKDGLVVAARVRALAEAVHAA